MARVSITRALSLTSPAAIRAAVAEAISLVCDLRDLIDPGQTVVLKPNPRWAGACLLPNMVHEPQ